VLSAKDIRTFPTIAVTIPMKEFHCSFVYPEPGEGVGLVLLSVVVAGPAATRVGGKIMSAGVRDLVWTRGYAGGVRLQQTRVVDKKWVKCDIKSSKFIC